MARKVSTPSKNGICVCVLLIYLKRANKLYDTSYRYLVTFLPTSSKRCIKWNMLPAAQIHALIEKRKSRQRSGKGAIRKRFPLQKPRWGKTKITIRYLHHEKQLKHKKQLILIINCCYRSCFFILSHLT